MFILSWATQLIPFVPPLFPQWKIKTLDLSLLTIKSALQAFQTGQSSTQLQQ